MKNRFEQYDDDKYYEPITSDSDSREVEGFLDWFIYNYQSGKIKLDISVGVNLKYLDILSIESIS